MGKRTNIKNKEHLFTAEMDDELMKFLIKSFPGKNRNNIKTFLRDRQVLVNEKVVTQYNHPVKPKDIIKVRLEKIPLEKDYYGYTIVYEDKYLVVIDKHAGVLSVSTDKKSGRTAYSMLSEHVKKQKSGNKIFIVHRLDRDTSGLMMFAKDRECQKKLQEKWNQTIEERSYLALVEGVPEEEEGEIVSFITESPSMKVYSVQDPKYGLRAVTGYKIIKTNGKFSLLKVDLGTGRKNQIRVHMQDIGHPIVGDSKYGSKINPIGRLGLHAQVLAFRHPISDEVLRFESTVPKKFKSLV